MYCVRTVQITLEKPTADFVARLEEKTGTPANEILTAIVNGHIGGCTCATYIQKPR